MPLRIAKRTDANHISAAATEAPGEIVVVSHAASVEPLESAKLDYVAQRTVMIREAPYFASQAIEEIGGGTPIAVVEIAGDWFKVRTAHSRVPGFVRKEFIAPAALAR